MPVARERDRLHVKSSFCRGYPKSQRWGRAADLALPLPSLIGSREDRVPQIISFPVGPSTSHHSIKRKETAGVLGEGEGGAPGYVG